MEKIINQKRYNTETAKEVGNYAAPCASNDAEYWRETLYQKRTGEFFIHGEGGGSSRYANRLADGWGWGERLVPLSYDEAREWVKKYLDADTYERLFELHGEEGEEEQTTQIHVLITQSAADKLKKMAAKQGKTKNEIIGSLIENAEF